MIPKNPKQSIHQYPAAALAVRVAVPEPVSDAVPKPVAEPVALACCAAGTGPGAWLAVGGEPVHGLCDVAAGGVLVNALLWIFRDHCCFEVRVYAFYRYLTGSFSPILYPPLGLDGRFMMCLCCRYRCP